MPEKEKKEFATQCSQKETFSALSAQFIGFDNNEFDSVLVKEFRQEVLVDSFNISVAPMSDETYKSRRSTIYRNFNINHAYHFIVPNQRPFILSNMKMVILPDASRAFTEGYRCRMADFTIDGIRFKNDYYPKFVKQQ